MRRIIASLAISADGFIARPDGAVDWLERPMPEDGYGMAGFMQSIDTILWGRKTYDFAVNNGGFAAWGDVKHFAFSHTPPANPDPAVEFVTEPIAHFAAKLRQAPGKDIWMMGGAGIIAAFLDAGALDEFSLHVIPVMIGQGIPLLSPAHRSVPLELLSTRTWPDGVVHLNYRILSHRS